MCAAREAVIAAEVARDVAPGKWGITFSLVDDKIGMLRCGTPLVDIIDKFDGAEFIGINCMDGRRITDQIKYLKSIIPAGMRIAAYGNIGFWVPPAEYQPGIKQDNDAQHDAMYAEYVMEWLEAGATIVGGCCGTSPSTIRLIADKI